MPPSHHLSMIRTLNTVLRWGHGKRKNPHISPQEEFVQRTAVAFVVAIAACSVAAAQYPAMVFFSGSDNLNRGYPGETTVTIGALGGSHALAFDSQGFLYATVNGNLTIVNQETAAQTTIGASLDFESLAFGPGDQLFGVNGTSLYQVNAATGDAVLVADLSAVVTDGLIGLDYDSTSDLYYAFGFQSNLYEITTSFQATLLGVVDDIAPVRGMTITDAGEIYTVNRDGELYLVNPTTLVATFVDTPFPRYGEPGYPVCGDNQALAFGPRSDPGSLIFSDGFETEDTSQWSGAEPQ